ncbi:MAG: hypothetical protein ACKVX7_01170 [Planctomycetota bacterium]
MMKSPSVRMFGEVAFEKGYITTAQLYEALSRQAHQEAENGPRQFLGEILVELRYMNEKQVLEILTEMHGSAVGTVRARSS